jgi:hypothetical protein
MRSSKNEHLFFVFLGSASTETDGVKAGGCLSDRGKRKDCEDVETAGVSSSSPTAGGTHPERVRPLARRLLARAIKDTLQPPVLDLVSPLRRNMCSDGQRLLLMGSAWSWA